MNLLYLCAFLPSPADDGDKVRALWTLRALATRHRLYGFFLSPDGRTRLPREVSLLCREAVVLPQTRTARMWGAVRSLVSGEPLHTGSFWTASAQRRLSAAAAGWPVAGVHVHRLRMMPYAARLGLPYMLDCTDSIADYYGRTGNFTGWRRLYARRDRARVAAAERQWGSGAAAVLAITAGERRKLLATGVRAPIFVAPNALNLRRWRPVHRSGGARTLLFLGNLAYPPNRAGLLWFLERVAPRLRGLAPRATLTVVGGGASRALVGRASSAGMPVRFTGFVPDVRAAYAGAAALICPLPVAAGLQNKALEAMAAGIPVVATPNVAAALGARRGVEVLVGSTPAAFAACCRDALVSGAVARRMTVRARRFVERTFDERTAVAPVLAAARLVERAAAFRSGRT